MQVRYVDSTSRAFDQTLLAWLLAELPQARVFAAATGYIDSGVLDWIEPNLASLLAGGGTLTLAVGSNQGQTSREDVERLFALIEAHITAGSSLFVVHIPGGLFHPKTYFASRPGHFSALIGSPNLTAASSTVNIETAVVVESDQLEAPLDLIQASMTRAAFAGLANAFEVTSVADIGNLEGMGAIGVPRPVTRPATGLPAANAARARRRLARFPPGTRVLGVPPPTARRRGTRHVPALLPPAIFIPITPAAATVAFVFSPNDLKQTGTREFSVPAAVRGWAGGVLGVPVQAAQGDLLHFTLLARLAGAPNTVSETPAPVRLWSAGASGGTHRDVRMVIGSLVRDELEETSQSLRGVGVLGADIGVLELPADPTTSPVRLTVYQSADADFPTLDALCVRAPGALKRQAVLTGGVVVPPWPY